MSKIHGKESVHIKKKNKQQQQNKQKTPKPIGRLTNYKSLIFSKLK